MNKQQISYLSDKVSSSISKALHVVSKRNSDVLQKLVVEQFEKAGFTMKTGYHTASSVLSYVYNDELLAARKSLDEEYNKLSKSLEAKRSSMMDTIILGDSKDAMAILEKFNAELEQLTK